jgi:hypothetical protein
VFPDEVKWYCDCRFILSRGALKNRSGPEVPLGEVTVNQPLKAPDCAPMATHSEVIGVGAGLGATKKGKMAPDFS